MGKELKKYDNDIEGLLLTSLKVINVSGGDVLHAMKNTDKDFTTFGEAYFSEIFSGSIKGWKRHRKMTLNLIVPIGSIRFVIFNSKKLCKVVTLSKDNYSRLTIPPML